MEHLNALVELSYIDDLYERVWPVSAVIDYAAYAKNFAYDKDYPKAVKMIGTEYFPLRKEFCVHKEREIPEKAKNVLVVTGGSDEYHFMQNILNEISDTKELDNTNFRFVCGNFNRDIDYLKQAAAKNENIVVMKSLPTLKGEIENADIIVTAGGTTLYEAAALGIPIICFSFVDNQLFNVKSFSEGGYAYYAGDLRSDFSYKELIKNIIDLIDDKKRRKEMSERLLHLVDGKGASRIAKALMA